MAVVFACGVADARVPQGVRVAEAGGAADEIGPAQRALIERELSGNRERLRRAGLLPALAAPGIAGTLQWPLRATAAFTGFFYSGVSNFVDHDPRAPGFLQDYACGTRTYDSANGSNHAGTDYFLTPFSWLMMDQGQVAVVAAAPGTIVGRSDGNFDRSCKVDFSKTWNAVYVQHGDGSVAWYGHLKSGSVTAKAVGSHVDAGEMLGLVGSSGASSGPHLHFELHGPAGGIADPRHGDCNAGPEWWATPQAYEDPRITTLSTHAAEPEFVDCGVDASGNVVTDVPHFTDEFAPGATIHVLAGYRDQRVGEVSHFAVVAPDGSIVTDWDFDLAETSLPRPFYAGTAFSWTQTLPADARPGVWRITASFIGRDYDFPFIVAGPVPRDPAEVMRARIAVGANATRCRANPSAPGCPP